MECFLFNKDKKRSALPPPLSYSVRHGMGEPCDAFELTCAYRPELRHAVEEACFFAGAHNGEMVFIGVLDEYELGCDKGGTAMSLSGRGLAALLLDNESAPSAYEYCTLDAVLREHVFPYGIRDVERCEMGGCRGYAVESGASEWKALCDFALYAGGVRPRFSREGRLILSNARGSSRQFKTADTSECRFRGVRYGVISQAEIRRFDGPVEAVVNNEPFLARGGSAKRVITLPREAGFDYVRYTGEYRIRRSMEESAVCELCVPRRFAAFPGDVASLELPAIGVVGDFRVIETETWLNASGCGTEIKLIPEGVF